MTADQAEFLDIIDQNARRLLTLINDLLTLSGLESGRMVIRPEPVDLRELVRANVQRPRTGGRRPIASSSTCACRTSRSTAVVDSDRISQVLSNLVSNAIKFTPDERPASASGSPSRAAEAVLRVEDSGIGISEDDRERLFERFFRAGNAVEQAIPGTGLGLAICKGIVDAHGGISRSSRRSARARR